MKSSERFIMKPLFNNLAEAGLHYKDILTYVAIRSFYNTKDKYCYPSYQTIAKRAGVGTRFISQSAKRLEAAGFLDVWNVGKTHFKHYYKFPQNGSYQKVPFDLLADKELTVYEKSMLLLVTEYCNNDLVCSDSITEIAISSGQTYRTIHKQVEALLLKGYIVQESFEDAASRTIRRVLKLSGKVNWSSNVNLVTKDVSSEPNFNIDKIITMATSMLRQEARALNIS